MGHAAIRAVEVKLKLATSDIVDGKHNLRPRRLVAVLSRNLRNVSMVILLNSTPCNKRKVGLLNLYARPLELR